MKNEPSEEHRPTLVHFGDRHSYPAEVCWGCSSEGLGIWVPVTECEEAVSKMTDDASSLYADSVTIRRNENT